MGTDALQGLPYARQIRLAISDPGAILPRAKVRDTESESVTEWQARAVEVVLALHLSNNSVDVSSSNKSNN